MTENSNQHSGLTEEERELMEQKKRAVFQAVQKMKIADTSPSMTGRPSLNKYSIEQINRFIQDPSRFEKEMRQLSDYLYHVSAEFRIIIDYVSNLGRYAYVLDTLNVLDEDTDFKAFRKAKLKASSQLEKMSLQHELSKAMKIAWRFDTVYCYEHETKDSYILQHMDNNYCRLSGFSYDGVFSYQFDFSYFDGNPELLKSYPVEFSTKYQMYKTTKEKWQELNPDKAFAFKVNEEIQSYSLLPYSILFEPILDFEESKKIHKARIKMDNFMLLVQQIPVNDKNQGMDDFLISLDTAMEFHNFIVQGIGDNPGIGVATTPMKIDTVRTEKSGNKDKDSVAMALRSIYDAGGISQFLVNSDKSTSIGVAKSIILDEQKIYKMFRQIERWLNRKLLKLGGKFKFKVKLLDTTNFDEAEAFESFLAGAQNGIPSIEESAAAMGISYLSLHNKIMIENSEIGIRDKMKPLATSHTQSNKDNTGKEKISDDKATDSTIVNRDNDTDENRE